MSVFHSIFRFFLLIIFQDVPDPVLSVWVPPHVQCSLPRSDGVLRMINLARNTVHRPVYGFNLDDLTLLKLAQLLRISSRASIFYQGLNRIGM
ncbi:hypothetical protein TNCV_2218101 [Trichonephila clavipes]|nr:hypothetical protein TNCV_2218101 [Trichonephila clavipes]